MWTLRIHDVQRCEILRAHPSERKSTMSKMTLRICYTYLYKYVIVFNHFKNELTLVEMLSEGEESGLPELEAAIETGIMLLTTSL